MATTTRNTRRSPVRVAALDTFCQWYGDGVDALKLMTRFRPPYAAIVTAFNAELQLLEATYRPENL